MKKAFRSVLFVVLLALSFMRVSDVLVYDNNPTIRTDDRREQFEEDLYDNIDVLYAGGSKIYVDFIPISMWQKTGLVGINVATNTQPPFMTYHVLKSSIKETNPQLVIMDLPGLDRYQSPAEVSNLNNFIQAMDLIGDEETRKEIVKEMEERYGEDGFDPKWVNFPFYKDHSRWDSLNERDFHDTKTYEPFWLGGSTRLMRDYDLSLDDRPDDLDYEMEDVTESESEYYYQKAIDMLKEEGIEILIVIPPTVAPNEENVSAILTFAEKNDLIVLNYNDPENFERMNFRYRGDFYDNNHLSLVGAEKFMNALAEDISDFYIPKKQSAELEEKFEQYYLDYLDYYVEIEPRYDF